LSYVSVQLVVGSGLCVLVGSDDLSTQAARVHRPRLCYSDADDVYLHGVSQGASLRCDLATARQTIRHNTGH